MDIVQQQIFQRLIEKLMTRNGANTNNSNNFYYNNYDKIVSSNNKLEEEFIDAKKVEEISDTTKLNNKNNNKVNGNFKTMESMMEKLKENHQILDTTNSSDDGLKNGGSDFCVFFGGTKICRR